MNKPGVYKSLIQITFFLTAGSFVLGNLIVLPLVVFYDSIINFVGFSIMAGFLLLFFWGRYKKYRQMYVSALDENKVKPGWAGFLKAYFTNYTRGFLRFTAYVAIGAILITVLFFLLSLNVKLLAS